MKILKNSFTFLIILPFVLSNPSLSGKRDLSTPLSRLVGHWIDSDCGMHYYFSPITDKLNMTGSMVVVAPDKNMIKKYFDKLMKIDKKTAVDLEDYIEKYVGDFDVVMALAEEARYLQYKLKSQKPNGLEISIEVINYPQVFRVFSMPGELIMLIDKKGEQIKFKYPYLDEEYLKGLSEYEAEMTKFVYSDWIYIDSKTSPDNTK